MIARHNWIVAWFLILGLTATVLRTACGQENEQRDIAWQVDPVAAVDQARRQGKRVVVYVTAAHCGYCRKMDRDTWAAPDVKQMIDGHYAALRVDADRNGELAARLKVRAFPTVLVFDGEGRYISSAQGFLDRRELLTLLAR